MRQRAQLIASIRSLRPMLHLRRRPPNRGRCACAGPLLGVVLGLSAAGAAEPPSPLDPMIGFDVDAIDADGLVGPPGGKVAVDYEFCIPAQPAHAAEVQVIDPSARFYPGSRGRIGCAAGAVLVLGNTHQSDFAGVLRRLAELPYVARIERAWFE